MQDVIPEFKRYSDSQIFSRLSDISGFGLRAEIPRTSSWSEDAFANRVVTRIYERLREVVKAAGFHYEDELRQVRRTTEVGVEYADDRYDFAVRCSESQIAIERRGSRLRNFHDWYSALMPSAQGIMSSISTILSEETNRKVDLLRVSFRFSFLVHDLIAENTGQPVRNSEIMQKLLKGFPDDNGRITDNPAVLGSVGRADFAATRWLGEKGSRRLVRFQVEAPANMGWSSLWFTFSYGGESYTSPDGLSRESFDPNGVLSEYYPAYVTFLRDSAINGFMEYLLRGYQFKATPTYLP